MRKKLQNQLLIALGWLFILVGLIGVVLPVLPTTPFMILALALFSKSSPRFHQMLLNNRWFGPALQEWERNKTLSRKVKIRATIMIIVAFTISIGVLWGKVYLQLMLVFLALILLTNIWRIKETL